MGPIFPPKTSSVSWYSSITERGRKGGRGKAWEREKYEGRGGVREKEMGTEKMKGGRKEGTK